MDDDGFTDYASARWASLVGSAVLLGCPPSDAEDLVQQTLMRVYASWTRVRAADNPDAYVYKILLNASRERHRRRRWRELADADPGTVAGEPGRPAHDLDDADAVERALRRIPDEQRRVIVLRYYAHLTDVEVAAALAIPVGTVKSRIARGLDRLATDAGLTDNRAEEGHHDRA